MKTEKLKSIARKDEISRHCIHTWVGGLRTRALPAITAGAIFETARLTRQLIGGIAKTTPRGICSCSDMSIGSKNRLDNFIMSFHINLCHPIQPIRSGHQQGIVTTRARQNLNEFVFPSRQYSPGDHEPSEIGPPYMISPASKQSILYKLDVPYNTQKASLPSITIHSRKKELHVSFLSLKFLILVRLIYS